MNSKTLPKFDYFYKYEAIFNPKNRDTLRPELEKVIGKKLKLKYYWTQDRGVYKDQPVFCEDRKPGEAIGITGGHWIPIEDLDEIKII